MTGDILAAWSISGLLYIFFAMNHPELKQMQPGPFRLVAMLAVTIVAAPVYWLEELALWCMAVLFVLKERKKQQKEA